VSVAEPVVAAAGAGGRHDCVPWNYVFPANLLNFFVRVRHDVVAVTVMHLGESDITCGAARSILPGRASHDVRSSRNNVASSARMATHP